jgi:hypothetical protein
VQASRLAFAAAVTIVFATETTFAAQLPPEVAGHRTPSTARPHGQAPAARQLAARRKATPSPRLTPVQQTLHHDAALARAVSERLPPGTNLMEVSAGFKDVGQFVAAVNASRSLGIPMPEFRRRMVADGMPLLLAIQDIRPTSNYRVAARRAEEEAAAMIAPATTPPLTLAKGKE